MPRTAIPSLAALGRATPCPKLVTRRSDALDLEAALGASWGVLHAGRLDEHVDPEPGRLHELGEMGKERLVLPQQVGKPGHYLSGFAGWPLPDVPAEYEAGNTRLKTGLRLGKEVSIIGPRATGEHCE